jgi:hypothetical protein
MNILQAIIPSAFLGALSDRKNGSIFATHELVFWDLLT